MITPAVLEMLETRRLLANNPFFNVGDYDLAYDSTGKLHMAYVETSTNRLLFRTRDTAGNWSGAFVIDDIGHVDSDVSVAVDTTDRPGIVWKDTNTNVLRFAMWEDTNGNGAMAANEWFVKADVRTASHYPSLSWDTSSSPALPVLTYYRGGDLEFARLPNFSAGTAWSITNLDGEEIGEVGRSSSLARVPGTNDLGVTYHLNGTSDKILYRRRTGGAWGSVEEVIVGSGSIGDTSLVYTGSGGSAVAVVAYSDFASATKAAKLMTRGASSWSTTYTLDNLLTGSNNLWYGNGTFSWALSNGELDQVMLLSGSGGSWTSRTLHTNGGGGVQAAFKLVSGAGPTITYVHRRPAGSTTADLDDRAHDLTAIPPTPATTPNSATSVTLNWTSIANADTYEVSRSEDNSDSSTVILGDDWTVKMTTASLTYTDNSLVSGVSYAYTVRAKNGIGESVHSSIKVVPAVPLNFDSTSLSATEIHLDWSDISNETGYRIERQIGAGSFTALPTQPANTVTFTDTGLTQPNTQYSYRIAALNGTTASAVSAIVSSYTFPAVPTDLSADAPAHDHVNLSWSAPLNGAGSYRVERQNDDGTWSQVGGAVSGTSTQDPNVVPSKTYVYRVRAENADGWSAWSSTAQATTKLPAPTNVNAIALSANQIDLSWAAVLGATNYTVQRSPNGTDSWIDVGSVSTTSFSDPGRNPGTVYHYRVKATNSITESIYSSVANTITMPAAPADVLGSPVSTSQITVSWSASFGATSYQVERSDDGVTGWTQIGIASGIVTFVDDTATEGSAYYYRVRASNASGDSPYSNAASVVTPLVAPSNIAVNSVAAGSVSLSWVENSTAENGVVVDWSTDSSFTSPSSQTIGANQTSYEVTGLSNGTEYFFRVKVISTISDSAYATAVSAITVLPAPDQLSVVSTTATSITLAWADNSAGEDGFTIERSPDASFATVTTFTAPADTIGFTDSGLLNGTTYFYRVKATNAVTGSAFSATTSGTTILPAPSGLAATAVSPTEVALSWDDNSNSETAFNIDRKTGAAGTYVQIDTVSAGITSYSDTTAAEGVEYFYRVRAATSNADSAYSAEDSAVTPPHAPTNLVVTQVTASSVTLDWTDTSGAETGFVVERATNSEFTSATTYAVAAEQTSYTVGDLADGTQYYFRVKAVGTISESAYASGIDAITVLPAPSGLWVTAVTATSISLSWVDNSDNESRFEIDRATDSGFTQGLTTLTATANGTSYDDSGLTPEVTYYYRVRAANVAVESVASETASATTPMLSPAAPSTLTVTVDSPTELTLMWADNSTNEAQFSIERSQDGTTFDVIDSVAANTTSYTDAGLSPATQYFYRVRATNAGGSSAHSNVADGTTQSPSLAAPIDLRAVPLSTTQMSLAWSDDAQGEAGYRIEQSIDGVTYTPAATTGPNATSATINGLLPGHGYYFRVDSFVGSDHSDSTEPLKARLSRPKAPTEVSADIHDADAIHLTWVDNASNEAGYYLWKSVDGGEFTLVSPDDPLPPDSVEFTVTGLVQGPTYAFRVGAFNGVGSSATIDSPAVPLTAPTAPIWLAATPNGEQMDLSWTPPSYATEQTILRRRATLSGDFVWEWVASAGRDDTGASVSYVPGVADVFQIVASNPIGDSYSDPFTTPGSQSAPAVPAATFTKLLEYHEFQEDWSTTYNLAWPGSAYNANTFRIEKSTNGGASYSWLATVDGTKIRWAISSPVPSGSDLFRVVAVNAWGAAVSSPVAWGASPSISADTHGTYGPTSTTLEPRTNGAFNVEWERSNDLQTWESAPPLFSELVEAHTYYYRATVNGSAYGAPAALTTLPAQPTGLTVSAVAGDPFRARISWTDNSNGEDAYRIYRRAVGSTPTWPMQVILPAHSGTGAMSYDWVGIVANTQEEFRVEALRLTPYEQPSEPTGWASFSSGSLTTPTGLSVTAMSDRSVKLDWTDTNAGEKQYLIRRRPDGSDDFEIVGGNIPGDAPSYIDETVVPGMTYFYQVYAADVSGQSAGSNIAGVNVPFFDLDIDSYNDNALNLSPTTRTADEDEIEDETGDPMFPGKIVPVNGGDINANGVPDYADMLDGVVPPNATASSAAAEHIQFVPLVLQLPSSLDLGQAKLRITYSESNPADVTRSGSGTAADPYIYTPAAGNIRIWTRPAGATDDDVRTSRSFTTRGGSSDDELGFYVPAGEYGPLDLAKLGGWEQGGTITLYVEGITTSGPDDNVRIEFSIDPDGSGPAEYAVTDAVRVAVGSLDLDVDSDNNSDSLPHRDTDEELLEDRVDRAGKVALVNDSDRDHDGIPDLDDGFTGSAGNQNAQGRFVPIRFTIPNWVDLSTATISFEYDASDPAGISQTGHVPAPGSNGDRGSLRLWTKDGNALRSSQGVASGGDYVARGTGLTGAQLGLSSQNRTITLYVEAVRASLSRGDLRIVAHVDPDGTAGPADAVAADDAIRITAVQATASDTGLSHAVRLFDGAVNVTMNDLVNDGYGLPWGHTRTWSNQVELTLGDNRNGQNISIEQWPTLVQATTGVIVIRGGSAEYFDFNGTSYTARFGLLDALVRDPANGDFVLTDAAGFRFRFHGFDTTVARELRGVFRSVADPGGNLTAVTGYDEDGRIETVTRGTTRFEYSYLPDSGNNASAGKLERVKLFQGSDLVRQTLYTYYGDDEDGGNAGDLKEAVVQSGIALELARSYYRYYKPGEAKGYAGALKLYVGPAGVARLGSPGDLDTRSDADLRPYAEVYLEYDAQRRVARQDVQGAGPTAASGSTVGAFTFQYAPHDANGLGFGIEKYGTTINGPGGATSQTYSNFAGQPLRIVEQTDWTTTMVYDSAGRLDRQTSPGGVATVYAYFDGTNGPAGYLHEVSIIPNGQSGQIKQRTFTYSSRTSNDGLSTIHPVESETVYRGDDGSGAITTSYSYPQWDDLQSLTINVDLPDVSSSTFGTTGNGDLVQKFDPYGRFIELTDGDGKVTSWQYDDATGSLRQHIIDVGGLALTTIYLLDEIGRPILITRPNGGFTSIDYTDLTLQQKVTTTSPEGVVTEADTDLTTGVTVTRATSPIGSLVQVGAAMYDLAGRIVWEERSPASGTNYRTNYAYTTQGQVESITDPLGTIYKNTYDTLGRLQGEWIGVGQDLTLVASYVYDNGVAGGDSNMTSVIRTGGSTTVNTYDDRNRLTDTQVGSGSEATAQHYDYDNLGNIVLQTVTGTQVQQSTVNVYDNRGRLHSSTTDGGAAGIVAVTHWYDYRGNNTKTAAPGGLVTVTTYDAAGRAAKVEQKTSAGTVFAEMEATYDKNGNTTLIKSTNHGVGGDRVTYIANYYDRDDRLIGTANAGTTPISAPAPNDTPPVSSNSLLVTTYGYDDAGFLDLITDPRGVKTKNYRDNLGRLTGRTTGFQSTDERTVGYEYNGLDQLDLVTTFYNTPEGLRTQQTDYVYGISKSVGNGIDSNSILQSVIYKPLPAQEWEDFTYNAQLQPIVKRDRAGNTHSYGYDSQGRLVSDSASLAANADGSVTAMTYGYDALGRVIRYTSVGSGANEVTRTYDVLGNVVNESQEHHGSVTGASPTVQYQYAAANNGRRLVSVTYPDGRVLNFNYSGDDATINRVSSISEGAGTIESYGYLGLNTVLTRSRPIGGGNSIDQTLLLDPFGRVEENVWGRYVSGGGGTGLEHVIYGYDRSANRLFSDNQINSQLSELYHAGAPVDPNDAYTPHGEVQQFDRGELNANRDGIANPFAGSHAIYVRDGLGQLQTGLTDDIGDGGNTRIAYNTHDYKVESKYDAWGRLVRVDVLKSDDSPKGQHVTYRYDALNRMIAIDEYAEVALVNQPMTNAREFYHTPDGRVIEERTTAAPTRAAVQYVWSPVVGDIVLRDRDADGNASTGDLGQSGSGLDERLYSLTDPQGSVVAVTDVSGQVLERYIYDTVGNVQVLDAQGQERHLWGTSGFGDDALGEYFVEPARNFVGTNSTALSGTRVAWRHFYQGGYYDRVPGFYRDGVGGTFNPRQDKMMVPDPAAYATGGDAYDPKGLTTFDKYLLGGLHAAQIGLDIVGIVDPTGIADGVNAGLYALQGDWTNAGISLAGAVLPYAGDTLKTTRLVGGLVRSADTMSAATGLGRAATSRAFSTVTSGLTGAGIGAGSGFVYGSVNGLISTGTWDGAWEGGLAGAQFGAIQGGIGGAVRGFVNPYICFVAGTQVVVGVVDEEGGETTNYESPAQANAGGSTATAKRLRFVTMPIEQLVARGGGEMGDGGGQFVISRDQNDPAGPLVRRRISRTYRRTAYALRVLTVRDPHGREQRLRVTEEHPFYIEYVGWTAARSLEAGDTLLGAAGTLTVVSNEHEAHPDGVPVYNLEVEQAHTYFVLAENAPGTLEPVWVHNAEYDVGTYGKKASPNKQHHGVMDAWAENNIPGYRSRASDNPTIELSAPNHGNTNAVFREWLRQNYGRPVGAKVDWRSVSPREIQSLSERMFDAAKVPEPARREFYRAFNQYVYGTILGG